MASPASADGRLGSPVRRLGDLGNGAQRSLGPLHGAAAHLVGQGRGYSLLVTRPYSEHSYDGEPLVERPIASRVRSSRICLARRAAARPTRLVEAFTDFCREEVAKAACPMREQRSGA